MTAAEMSWENSRAAVSLLGCALASAVGGITLSFSLYAKALKDLFQLSQVQVSYLASATIFGHNVLLPAGFLNDLLGSKWSMVFGGLFTCVGWLIVLVNTIEQQAIDPSLQLILLIVGLTLGGHGRTYFFLSALATSVLNVPNNVRPVVLTMLEIVVGTMPLIFPLVFGGLLDHSHVRESCIKFFSSLVAINFCGAVAGGIFMTQSSTLRWFRCRRALCSAQDDSDEEGHLLTAATSSGTINSEETTRDAPEIPEEACATVLQLLLSVDYHLIFWTSTVLTTIAMFYDYNLVFLLTSAGHRTDSVLMITIYRVSVTSSRIVVGILLCFFRNRCWFPFTLPLVCATFTVTFVFIVVLFSGHLWCLRVAYAILGLSTGVVFVYPSVLIITTFGLQNFGRNVGIIYTAVAVLLLAVNTTFSYFYDGLVDGPDELYCYGKRCFLVPDAMTSVLSIISICFAVILLFRRLKKEKTACN